MPVRSDLIAEIDKALSGAAQLGYSNNSATNDVYEAYIWSLCVRAARQHNAKVRYETVSGRFTQDLLFRTSPGAVFSVAQQYTHALISFDDCPELEAHIGIRITGRSRVLHECDVAVLERSEGQLCRRERVHPRASKVLIAVERKFYTSSVQLYLGRGFLGLTSDIYRKERYFVTNSQSPSVTKLIGHHESEWDCGVLPNTKEGDALFHSIARAFRNYRAAY